MSKLLVALTTTVLLLSGLLASAGAPAQAGGYPARIKTFTRVTAPAKVAMGSRATVRVKVDTNGSATVRGRVDVTVKRVGGGYVFTRSRSYSGGTIKLFPRKVTKQGTYKVTAVYTPSKQSVYLRSSDTDAFGTRRR